MGHTAESVALSPILWSVGVTPFPSPCSLTEPASSDDQGRRMVAGGIGISLLERNQPMFGSPFAGVGRVRRDHGQAGIGTHLDQAIPEAPGRDASHRPTKASSFGSPRGTRAGAVPARLPSFYKVEVLDDDGPGPLGLGGGDQAGDNRRSLPSRVVLDRPVSSRPKLKGFPTRLPETSTTPAAR